MHRQIDRLVVRVGPARLDRFVQDGVRFSQLVAERESFVPVLSRALRDASFRPGAATIANAFIAGKWRKLARLGAVDMIAHGVASEVLQEQLEPRLSQRVYSYRRKRSPWEALRLIARIARRHRNLRPDPRTRGFYVLRTDIRSYAPTIPLGEHSALWPELLEVTGLDEGSPHWTMLRAMILQDLIDERGEKVSRERGVLFGAPTSNMLMNLYLMPLDAAMAELRGVYTRFGDDVLFMHRDHAVVRRARDVLAAVLDQRGLALNHDKLHVVYWNGGPRPSSDWPEATSVVALPFLGAAIRFDGTVALNATKWRETLAELRSRIRRTAALLPDETPESKARILSSIVNDAFDPRSPFVLSHEQMLGDLVSDRAQLAQLDYWIARTVAEAATGSRGPRAFRRMTYGWLRCEAGLESRVVARNRGRLCAT